MWRGRGYVARLWGLWGTNMVYRSPILIWWPGYIGRNNRPEKIFHVIFGGQKYDFFDFSYICTILCGMINIRFLDTFRVPKGQFPAKYHISGHYLTYYQILKKRIFWHFFMIFGNLPISEVAGIGRKWPDIWKNHKNLFFGLQRSVFIPKTSIYTHWIRFYSRLNTLQFWRFFVFLKFGWFYT